MLKLGVVNLKQRIIIDDTHQGGVGYCLAHFHLQTNAPPTTILLIEFILFLQKFLIDRDETGTILL